MDAPHSAFEKLYEKRLYAHRDMPFDKYIKLYACINVDGEIYCNEDDFRYPMYQNAIKNNHVGLKETAMMVDAIVMYGIVLKNRYGYDSA